MSALPIPASEDASSNGSLWLRAFRDVLEVDDLTEDSDFFRSGGYSLLAPQLVSRYEALSGWSPPVRLVFELGTPRQLETATAAWLEGDRSR